MLTMISMLLISQTTTPECKTSNNVQACGYHCRAELDQVVCAQTPQGFCTRKEQKLICWDPPEEVRIHAPESTSKVSCTAKYRDVQCGYQCVTSPNHLSCTQTPYGACATRFDETYCWDPTPAVVHQFSAAGLSGAQCVQTNETFACGWDCKKSYQQAACAQTPSGKCNVVEGKIACFDPPVPPITHAPAPVK